MKKIFDEIKIKNNNTDIAINFYKNGFDEVVIIAPGWCMTKDSNSFQKISEKFSKNWDVLTLDFRGHGKSGGLYTFGTLEVNDLETVIQFAKNQKYKKIHLLGFSLGAFVSLIYTAFHDEVISTCILVSVPSDFSKIENKMWKKEAWLETLKKFELSRFLSIRLCIIPMKKTKPIDIVDKIKTPTLFIAGGKDPTVYPWHTKILYEKAICDKKFEFFENGIHAEDLFLNEEEKFIKICFDWLKSK